MEDKTEGFNPEQHRFLENGKSWVAKSVPEFDFTPMEVKFQYNELVDKVTAANPGLTAQQASEKIWEAEKKYDHRFHGIHYAEDPNRRLVTERNRLAAMADLNLANKEDRQQLKELRSSFNGIVQEVIDKTGDPNETVSRDIDSVLLCGIATDLFEARDIMVEGPIIRGFEETEDPKISNELVRKFLKDTFGMAAVRRARVGRISKDDRYLIYRSYSNDRHTEEGNELLRQGVASWGEGGMIVTQDKEHYLRAEIYLEKAEDPDKIQHLYKIRATAGDSNGFLQIQLHSFGVEKSADFDYLSGIPLEEESDKLRAYILGTVAHEIAHRYEDQIPKQVFDRYRELMQQETTPQREKYVTDYVLKHEKVYGSNPDLLFDEDFAEAIRVYTTNAEYLKNNYPGRFQFIKDNFPFIRENGVTEALKPAANEKS